MTQEEFGNLQIGDTVRGKVSGLGYVVLDLEVDCSGVVISALAVRTQTLTQGDEWDLFKPLPVALVTEGTQERRGGDPIRP